MYCHLCCFFYLFILIPLIQSGSRSLKTLTVFDSRVLTRNSMFPRIRWKISLKKNSYFGSLVSRGPTGKKKKKSKYSLYDLDPGCFIPILDNWHGLLCVFRLRGARRQQRGTGTPWVEPRSQHQAASHVRLGAPLRKRMGWRKGLLLVVLTLGSPGV